MKYYFKDKDNKMHSVELYGMDKNTMTVCLDNWKVMTLKKYYRRERTWNDHMHNTPFGDYVNMPIYNTKKRIYLCQLMR